MRSGPEKSIEADSADIGAFGPFVAVRDTEGLTAV